MKLHRIGVALAAMMFLLAGISAAQQVKTDYDRAADFAQYKTFSWEHIKTKDPLSVDRIKNVVNATLAARGWMEVESGGDISIVAIQMTSNQETLNTFITDSEEDGAGDALAAEGSGKPQRRPKRTR